MGEPEILDADGGPALPSSPELRKLIDRLLRSDADLSSFCQDYFPDTELRFATNMERGIKISLLLKDAPPEAIASALSDRCEAEYARAWQELQQERKSKRPTANPYRGLEAFTEEAAHLFFGREAESDALWARCRALFDQPGGLRILTVLGPSGSGKSSLARAGLLPRLRRDPLPGPQPMRIATLRPGWRPLERLAQALLQVRRCEAGEGGEPSAAAISQLSRELGQCDADGIYDRLRLEIALWPDSDRSPLLLLVDQLEEIYTQASDAAARHAFIEGLLHAAADPARQVMVILTLRSDFIGETMAHRPLNRAIGESHVLVTAMPPAELRRAIAEPARRAQRPIDAPTIDLILSEALGSAGALPLLQFALHRVFEGMQAGRPAFATLREIGGVGGALAQRAQEIYERLPGPEQAMLRRALLRLIRLGDGTRDTRRQAAVVDLCGGGEREIDVLSVLRQLADRNARLVTLSESGGRYTAEITHEALFEHWVALRTWIAESRSDRRFHDRVADAARLWSESGRPAGRLWRAPDLDLLCDYQRRCPDDLSPLQSEFLLASQQALANEQAERAAAEALRAAQHEEIRQQLLSTYVDRGWQELERGSHPEAALWLQRAAAAGSREPLIPTLLAEAMPTIDAQVALFASPSGIADGQFSPDGNTLLLRHYDGRLWLWDLAKATLLGDLPGHPEGTVWARYTPDGEHILYGTSGDGGVYLQPVRGGPARQVCRDQFVGWPAQVSPDGRLVYTQGLDDGFRAWDLHTATCRFALPSGAEGPGFLELCPAGRYLVGIVGSPARTLRVYDARSGAVLRDCQPVGQELNFPSIVFFDDGRRFRLSANGKAWLYSCTSGRRLARMAGEVRRPQSDPHTHLRRKLVDVSSSGQILVYSLETGRLRLEFGEPSWRLQRALLSPDGLCIAATGQDRLVRIFEAETGALLSSLSCHRGLVRFARFSPDGRLLLTAGDDRTVRLSRLDALSRSQVWASAEAPLISADWSPRAEHVVCATSDRRLELRDPANGRLLHLMQKCDPPIVTVQAVSQLGRLAVGMADGTVQLWRLPEGTRLQSFPQLVPGLTFLQQSPEGRWLVALDQRGQLAVYTAGGELHLKLAALSHPLLGAKFSADGEQLLLWGHSHVLGPIALGPATASPGEQPPPTLHTDVMAVHEREGDWLAAVKAPGRTDVGFLGSGRSVCSLPVQLGWGRSACFSPDGNRLLLVGDDGRGHIWDPASGRLACELGAALGLIESLMFSKDGAQVFVISPESVQIFDAGSGRLISRRTLPEGRVGRVAVTADSSRLLLVTQSGALALLDLRSETRDVVSIGRILDERIRLGFEGRGLVRSHPEETVALAYAPVPTGTSAAELDGFSQRYREYNLALSAWQRGHVARAQRHAEQARAVLAAHDDRRGLLRIELCLAVFSTHQQPESLPPAIAALLEQLSRLGLSAGEEAQQLYLLSGVAHESLYSPAVAQALNDELYRRVPTDIGLTANRIENWVSTGQPAKALSAAAMVDAYADPAARAALLFALAAAALQLGQHSEAQGFLSRLRREYAAISDGHCPTWEYYGLRWSLSAGLTDEPAAAEHGAAPWVAALLDLSYLLKLPKSDAVAAQLKEICDSLATAKGGAAQPA